MKSSILFAVTTLLGIAGGIARAQSVPDRSFYVGVDLGNARFSRELETLPDVENEYSSLSYRLRFGYSFSRYFALEAAYTDYGSYDSGEGVACGGLSCGGNIAVTTEVRSVGLNAVGFLPVGERVTLKGQFGLLRREAELPYYSMTRDLDGSQWGIGVGYRISDKLDLSLDWISVSVTEEELGLAAERFIEGDSSMTSLGLQFRF